MCHDGDGLFFDVGQIYDLDAPDPSALVSGARRRADHGVGGLHRHREGHEPVVRGWREGAQPPRVRGRVEDVQLARDVVEGEDLDHLGEDDDDALPPKLDRLHLAGELELDHTPLFEIVPYDNAMRFVYRTLGSPDSLERVHQGGDYEGDIVATEKHFSLKRDFFQVLEFRIL